MVVRGHEAGEVATVAGLFVALAALLVALVDVFRGTETPPNPAALADDLARQLRAQWLDEAQARRLRDPRVLPLAWRTTTRDIADTLRAGPDGSRVLRLRLDGRLEGRFEEVTARLAEGYARVPNRRLVVVGEPGSGKTVLAVLLNLGLLAAREEGGPVPVLLPVSSWDPVRERLDDWIVRTMAQPYYNGRPDIPRTLLAHGLVVPVLDGLDEIPESARRSAIRALNQATGADRPLAVTCRAVEYEELIRGGAPTLRQAAVVEVLPVAAQDVVTYLRDVDWPAGVDWTPVFRHLRTAPDSPLTRALSTPLMVTSARLVYRKGGGDPAELLDTTRFDSEYAVEDHLLHGMLDAAYAPEPGLPEGTAPREKWSPEQARRWLTFLARHLHEHRERDLAWWQLSGRLLTGWAGPVAGICVGAVLAVGVLAWARMALVNGQDVMSDAAAVSLSAGVVFTLLNSLFWYASTARPPGRLTWSPRGSGGRLLGGFRTGAGLTALFAVPIVTTVTLGRISSLSSSGWGLRKTELCAEGIGICLALGVAVGLAFATHAWLDAPPSRAAQVSPMRTLAQDRLSSVVCAAAAGTVGALAGLPALWAGLLSGELSLRILTGGVGWPGHTDVTPTLSSFQWRTLNNGFGNWRVELGVAFLLPGVLLALLLLMSRAWPRFLLVRAWLAMRGRLPWRLMAFLADARRREILRQAGGAYQFRHIRLQETLAGEPVYRDPHDSRRAAVRRRTVLAVGIEAAAVGTAGAARRLRDTSIAVYADPQRRAVGVVRFRPQRREEVAYVLIDGSVEMWTGRPEVRESIPVRGPLRGVGGEYPRTRTLEFSADGNILVVPDPQGVLALDLKRSLSVVLKPTRLPANRLALPYALAYDSEHGYVVCAHQQGGVSVWKVAAGRDNSALVIQHHDYLAEVTRSDSYFHSLAFLKDGSLAVLDDTAAVRLEPPGFTKPHRLLPESRPDIENYSTFLSYRNLLLVSPHDNSLVVLDPDKAHWWPAAGDGWVPHHWPLPAKEAAAFHPHDTLLAAPDTNGSDLRFYRLDPAAGPRPEGRLLRGHIAPVLSLDFNADGSRLVSGDTEGTIRIWDVDDALG